MNFESIEAYISKFPIYQYAFLKPEEIVFSDKAKQMCRQNCAFYGQSWSCQPAVGKIEKYRENCLLYSNVLVFSTVSEVESSLKADFRKEAVKEHVRLTDIINEKLIDEGYHTFVLSAGKCMRCTKCTFPKALCRNQNKMYPCIESHGITISDLAEQCDMDYYMGENLRINFSLVFIDDGIDFDEDTD